MKDRIGLQLSKISQFPFFFAADSPLFSSSDSFTKILSLETTCLNMENLLWLVGIPALILKDIPFISGKCMALLDLFQFWQNICSGNTYEEVYNCFSGFCKLNELKFPEHLVCFFPAVDAIMQILAINE